MKIIMMLLLMVLSCGCTQEEIRDEKISRCHNRVSFCIERKISVMNSTFAGSSPVTPELFNTFRKYCEETNPCSVGR